MAWETRKRGGRYYTRSRREGGRIVREYIGKGEVAKLIAQLDQREQEEKAERRRADRLAGEEIEAREAPITALHDDVETLARGALLAAGYHRHHGQWRLRRG